MRDIVSARKRRSEKCREPDAFRSRNGSDRGSVDMKLIESGNFQEFTKLLQTLRVGLDSSLNHSLISTIDRHGELAMLQASRTRDAVDKHSQASSFGETCRVAPARVPAWVSGCSSPFLGIKIFELVILDLLSLHQYFLASSLATDTLPAPPISRSSSPLFVPIRLFDGPRNRLCSDDQSILTIKHSPCSPMINLYPVPPPYQAMMRSSLPVSYSDPSTAVRLVDNLPPSSNKNWAKKIARGLLQ